ncbi:glycoside hydrolase family 17 protein [Bipolaris sorokiniana ND90Pr]|uniref:Probable beta-glucosidase btgE n=1 Tax=Cochliobolus sativus (strain ND90Pr / ATCC 201652) TaxID=665912 RepID=M2TE11_COCSN|nr:glycoside hydrolase family 17 protein [Bipolaris sorokiniana ND90Pr]EMD66982.1 glycoside hydrolase family 17 protein [Bipolaris sorokiniana ND90Pr]
MKYAFVAAALAGSVFASQHKAHAGFHQRRHDHAAAPQEDVCTVYTTVYVTGPPPSYPTATPETPKPSSPAVPQQSQPPVYPHGGQPPKPEVPQQSQPVHPDTPKPSNPAVPQQSQPATYPAVPQQSQPPTYPQGGQPPKPEVPQPSSPAVPQQSQPPVYPQGGQPPHPAVPASTSCDEETPKPTGPAPGVPQQSQPPTYPGTPQPPQPEAPKPSSPAPTYPQGNQPPKPEAPKPSTPAVPQQSQPTYPGVPQPPKESKPAQTPSVPDANKPKPTPSSSSAQPKPTKPSGGNGHIVTNGDKWSITYTPYAQSGQCKEAGEVASDIEKIAGLGFTTIRVYNTDCGVFENVVPECEKHGLKIIYGIFLEAGEKGCFSEYANKQLDDIKNKAPKDSISMVIVGNECMFNGNCQPEQLASYIDHVRDELRGAGFPSTVPITTTEPVDVWETKGAALCSHIDVFVCQVQPYFTQSVSADMAGDFAAQQLEQASKVCPEAAARGAYIGEIGWPSQGQTNGKAVASPDAQRTAMQKIQEAVGEKASVFSFQDDTWKPAGAYGVEQHFGCVDVLA